MTMTTRPVRSHIQSRVFMDTVVTIELACPRVQEQPENVIMRAFGWFEEVERRCSRFDPESELRKLCGRPGEAVAVSPLLLRAVSFAVDVAAASDGAFNPAIGGAMEDAGFRTNHRSGREERSGAGVGRGSADDVVIDHDRGTITLLRPVLLDLGALAKGLAIDLAGQELKRAGGFAVDAGGDVLTGGRNADGEPWQIGLRHPLKPDAVFAVVAATDLAICTSGLYERGAHIVTKDSGLESAAISVTVAGPSAMVCDAVSTAVFALGPVDGMAFATAQGLDALIVTRNLETLISPGMEGLLT